MIYAHVLNRGGQGVRSPIDDLVFTDFVGPVLNFFGDWIKNGP